MNSDFSFGIVSAWNAAQCGQVIEAYSMIVTGASALPRTWSSGRITGWSAACCVVASAVVVGGGAAAVAGAVVAGAALESAVVVAAGAVVAAGVSLEAAGIVAVSGPRLPNLT